MASLAAASSLAALLSAAPTAWYQPGASHPHASTALYSALPIADRVELSLRMMIDGIRR